MISYKGETKTGEKRPLNTQSRMILINEAAKKGRGGFQHTMMSAGMSKYMQLWMLYLGGTTPVSLLSAKPVSFGIHGGSPWERGA